MSKQKQPNKSRRRFLAGVGGVMVGLPFLEGLAPRGAKAGEEGVEDRRGADHGRQGSAGWQMSAGWILVHGFNDSNP